MRSEEGATLNTFRTNLRRVPLWRKFAWTAGGLVVAFATTTVLVNSIMQLSEGSQSRALANIVSLGASVAIGAVVVVVYYQRRMRIRDRAEASPRTTREVP